MTKGAGIAMRDSEFRELIERIKDQTDIVQIIGQHVALDQHNKALCPFHEEKTPSFSVNSEERYFHCFGCGKGGDVIKFLELYEKMPFMEAISELARQLGLSLPNLTDEDRDRIKKEQMIEGILKDTAQFYHKNLTPEVRKYLIEERGFTAETISRFQIGYAAGGLRAYPVDRHKLPVDLCIRAGVLKETDEGSLKDYFYKRIIFPNLKRGRVVHLSGRSLDEQKPKYLHLPGEIRYLYNEDALTNKEVYIVEGIPDCLSAVQAGYPAVAILGSSGFKPGYVPKFTRCETIYVCLDGDEAGKNGALKIGGLIGERAKIIQLPEGLDLNDYLREHPVEDFAELAANAKGIISYELSFIPSDTDKTVLPQKLDPILKKLALMEKVQADAYLSYGIKSHFGLNREDIVGYRQLVNKYRKEESQASSTQTTDGEAGGIYTALFDCLVDLVEHEGNPAFLIKEEGKVSVLPSMEIEGILHVPPPKDQIPWLLPRGEEVLKLYELQEVLTQREIDEALYDDLLSYHRSISQLPGEEYYDLVVAWDFHTYLLEAVQYSPIICLFAVPERGKSRTGKGMIYVAYHGIHVESLRDAYLVRVAHDLQASLFFDVKDIWRKSEKNGSEDILLHRFEKGAKVPRVLYPERGAHQDIVYYSIFGPTIIGTNEGVHKILETRAIHLNMPETSKRFENDVTPELSLPLKERLVTFRARYLGENFANIQKPAAGRLGDILKPLQQIIRMVRPDREPAFLSLVKELEAEKMIEKRDSLEAEILLIIIGLKDQVERGILPVKIITDTFNEGLSERSQITYQRVGRRLSAMAFKKAKTSDGGSAIIWDDASIERMKETYGLRKTSETLDTSEVPEERADVTDLSGDTDVSRSLF
ncbi:DNA primase [Candidatus Poribacteria bacterium]